MSDIGNLSIPEGNLTNPKGLISSFFGRFRKGSSFAIGLIFFLVGVMFIVMIAKRVGLKKPAQAIEKVTG